MKNIFGHLTRASVATSILVLSFALFFYTFPRFSYEVISNAVQENISKQVQCLAKNIYYEASNQDFEGKLAVAQVTVNRASSGKFPTDICDVVYQKTLYNGVTVCQFSWTCQQVLPPKNEYLWEESKYIANKVLTTPLVHSKLKESNVLYYHADYVNPGWNKEHIVTKIGNHIFYKKI
jgi:spore germination cell wall hydrolase CwlJ-like protein